MRPVKELPALQRARQGAMLVAGGLLLEVLVGRGQLAFWWTPLLIGVAYLAAAVSGGRTGSYWATAAVLVGWGGVVVWLNESRPDVFAPAAHAFGMGLGVLLAAAAARAGRPVDLLGAGLTATAAGLVFMLEPEVDSFGDPTTFAVVLVAVGAFNLVLAAKARGGAGGDFEQQSRA
jgi:hypothetical protein